MKPFAPQGLDLSQPPELLDEQHAAKAENVRFAFGVVRPRPGQTSIALPATPGTPRWIGRFYTFNNFGAPHTICLTDTKAFRFVAGVWTQIVSTPGAFTGAAGSWSVTAGEGWLFWSKLDAAGVYGWSGNVADNIVLLSDDTGGVFADSGTGTPINVPSAQEVCYYNNRLFLVRPNEAGGDTRVRWSSNGRSTNNTAPLGRGDWNTDPGTGGSGGFIDIFDPTDEKLTAAKVFRDRMVVFKRHSLHELYKTGLGTLPHVVELRVVGVGCKYQYSVQGLPSGLVFGADENVYVWDGNSIEPIGMRVQSLYQQFSLTGGSMFSGVDSQRTTYHLQLTGDQSLVYDYLRDIWNTDSTRFGAITALGEGDLDTSSFTWLTWPGVWTDHPEEWNAISSAENPQFFGGESSPATFYYKNGTVNDYNNSPVAFSLRLNENANDGKQLTITRVGISHKPGAGRFLVLVFVNRGTNLVSTPLRNASPKGWSWFDVNRSADTIQIEVQGTGLAELWAYFLQLTEGGQVL